MGSGECPGPFFLKWDGQGTALGLSKVFWFWNRRMDIPPEPWIKPAKPFWVRICSLRSDKNFKKIHEKY